MVGQQLEGKWVYEYINMTWPDKLYWTRVHLGTLPIKKFASMYEVAMHWADAVVFDGSSVIIVEGKLRGESAGVGQLQLYYKLFRETPRFSDLWNYPIKLVLLCARQNLDVKALCADTGIEYAVYAPEWITREISKRYGVSEV